MERNNIIKTDLFLLAVLMSIGFLVEKMERLFLIRKASLLRTSALAEMIAVLPVLMLIVFVYVLLKDNSLVGYFFAGLGLFALLFSTFCWYIVSQKTYIALPILIFQAILISISVITLIRLRRNFAAQQ